jgi:asparagine synthase (glutamine-hydrolysing)
MDLLPNDILQKPKHGFEVPLQRWLNGPLRHHVQKHLSPAFVKEQGIFDNDTVAKLLRKLNSSNPGDSAALVWTLLNFQQTWSTYFNA